MLIEDFVRYKICNSLSWVKVYTVLRCTRAFGQLTESAAVEKFCRCGVKRFSEHATNRRDHFYETKECGSLLRDRYPVAQSALLFLKKYLIASGVVRLRFKVGAITNTLFYFGQISYAI